MLYPAPNIVGLFAAVVTHGVLLDAAKNSQKQKMREKADEVLVPYKSVLDGYMHHDLMQSSLEEMATSGSKKLIKSADQIAAGDLVIESMPMFSLTQDQRALILDNPISIGAINTAPSYQTVVRVVSTAKDAEDLIKFWTVDNGNKLKAESARLLAASLDIALSDLADTNKSSGAYKTIRYLEGGTERMERGQPISERCNQMVLRTLRGNLMSVPLKNGGTATDTDTCTGVNGVAEQRRSYSPS